MSVARTGPSRTRLVAVLAAILAGCLALVGCSGGGNAEPAAPAATISSDTFQIAGGDVLVSLISVNWDAKSEDSDPAAGNRFFSATFKIENQSADQFVAYESILFEYYAADGTSAMEAAAVVKDDLYDAPPVDQGKSVTGAVIFEIPESVTPRWRLLAS